MRIQIEDYSGNDIIIIDYCQLKPMHSALIPVIGTIASISGFNIADTDLDENNNEYVRIQFDEKGLDKLKLKELINNLNTRFL